jgi:signal peptide peptidase SppA
MSFPRESIFFSSLRSFFKAFFMLLGLFFAILPILFFINFLSTDQQPVEPHTITLLPDLQGQDQLLPPTTPVILRIDIHGEIGAPNLTAEEIENQLLDSQKGFLKGGRVKGILLHLDTPGGTTTDSDNIYRALLAYKEKYHLPIHAYVDGLCASGGVYVTSAADSISASPVSVIGSVGVRMGPFFNVSDLLKKWEIQAMTLSEGKDKDLLNPTRPWIPGEEDSLKKIQSFLYERFVSIVCAARPFLDREKLVQEYGAHVFDGQSAQNRGYIDEANGSYDKALSSLLKAAGIDEKKPYQVVIMHPKFDFWKNLLLSPLSLFQGKITHTIQLDSHPDLKDPFLYLYDPKCLTP